ncbi:MAG: porin [Variovorax sp.]|nr:MAG: porin [Variovorax sp.]
MHPLRKSLPVLFAAGAAGASLAQSNVVVFGVLDTSIAHIRTDAGAVTGLASGGVSSSRLGFRGIEDLGGGLSGGFWLEAGVNPDTGNAGGFQFDRRSTLSLADRRWGELRLGRDKIPAYLNIETFDPFNDIGIGGIGGSNLIGNATTAAGTAEGSAPKRASNGINYVLPATLGGFYGQIQYAFGEQASNVGNSSLRDSAALRLGYKAGALNVALGHGRVRGGTTATGVDYDATNIGASYDLGGIKPMAVFATERGNDRRIDLLSVGATVAVGAGEFRAAFTTFRRKDVDDAGSTKLSLGYGHDLSKRTQLYATVSRVDNDRLANRGLAVSSASLASPAIAAGSNVTGCEFGIRHSF